METTQNTHFVDPGEHYGLDIEKATMYIARAAEWPEGSREREIERHSMGWKILRAYVQMYSWELEDWTGPQRYNMLVGTVPGKVFRTPRPVWAVNTNSYAYDGGDECLHELRFYQAGDMELRMEQRDKLDQAGNVTFGTPVVVLDVNGKRQELRGDQLMKLRQAVEAASVHDGRYGNTGGR